MSELKTRVGNLNIRWKTIPRGREGTSLVQVESGEWIEVKWKQDSQGIWVIFPSQIRGFDLLGQLDEEGKVTYQVLQRNSDQQWSNLSSSFGDLPASSTLQKSMNKVTRVRAQMPGKMIRILVEVNQSIKKGEPIAVMEAMKMENEIRAPQTGKITHVKVNQGQTVETGADLVLIEPQLE
jgi:biotin carboxyl carrier protein